MDAGDLQKAVSQEAVISHLATAHYKTNEDLYRTTWPAVFAPDDVAYADVKNAVQKMTSQNLKKSQDFFMNTSAKEISSFLAPG